MHNTGKWTFGLKLASCLLHKSKDTKHWEIGSIKIYLRGKHLNYASLKNAFA